MSLSMECQVSFRGTLEQVIQIAEGLGVDVLADQLAQSSGLHGYTPLHEAVASEKPEVLDYLLARTGSAGVDCKAKNGYTPLHLAASRGSVECVRVLLRHGADIFIRDRHNKIPRQAAESITGLLFGPVTRSRVLKLLRDEEFFMNSDNLSKLLDSTDQFEEDFLNRALMAATRNDNHFLIGKLLLKGATNLNDCLVYVRRKGVDIPSGWYNGKGKPHARAMLLLIKAAFSGNKDIVQKLFGETVDKPNNSIDFSDSGFPDVRWAVISGEVSTVVPIEIARRNGHHQVLKELLLKTEVNQEEGYVYWDGFMLLHLELSWLKMISWVKRLRLAKNGLTTLPNDMRDYLQQVTVLDLEQNDLSRIPGCLLKLPSLQELVLSHNRLSEIPDVLEWSACLAVLDLSFNQLSAMPINVVAPIICSLNLSHNELTEIPRCLLELPSLHELVLSHNRLSEIPDVPACITVLDLSFNQLSTMPINVVARSLNLSHNELTAIPRCLLELPRLQELLLSHNRLSEIPDVPEWSACLTVLDLSFNQLSAMPINVVAPVIKSLNLSHNAFRTVPLCICSFVTLLSLNLSDNPDILTLPAEMGRLSMLNRLYLNNLKNLNDPPRKLQKDPRGCIRYLYSKLRCPKGFYRMKLMLVGLANRGKTTLVKRLQDKECGNEYESTVGIDISEWWFKPSRGKKPFHFSIWDFGGQQEYYATHQCFLSRRSLYLLLFNLTHGEAGVEELKPSLNNIALRAPRSCVIIIGTHLDEVPEDKREEIDNLLNRVGVLAETYHKLQIVEVMPVGLKNRIENIRLLKEAIYNYAANYKTRAGQHIMGQKIPASYHALDKQLKVVQQEVRQGLREPIMHSEEFNTMVQQMNLADIQDEEELKTATLFLGDVGSLLHYDDRSHNLDELYFVDPPWLCDMMSKVVTIKERNPKGILYSKDIPMLFKDDVFPWKYFEQYLALLDRFEIALPLDNRRVLIPSMLPEERPKHLASDAVMKEKNLLVYSRYILFNSADTPPGFWSRLLSRIMHSIPQICFALDKTAPSTLLEDTPDQEEERLDDVMQAAAPPSLSMDPDNTPAISVDNSLLSSSPVFNHFFSFEINEQNECDNSPMPPIAPPDISRPMRQDSQHQLYSAPQLLPNFPSSLPLAMQDSYDVKEIQLDYWKTGLYYNDPEPLMFRIESLAESNQRGCKGRNGVLIVASPNNQGKKIIGQLVDLVISLIQEWYPGLEEGHHSSNNLEQRVPCFECLKADCKDPFEFKVEHCLPEISLNRTTMECGYHKDDPAKNHTVALSDIVPDLLLQDIDPTFLLNADDISYQEDDSHLLGKGACANVYKGKCHNQSVAIKKYISRSISDLRSETKLLQQSHHPCLICLVGVCVHPFMALVLEEAPLKSLEFPIMKKKTPVHRLTLFRIAAEVAAALRYLHGQGIIFRNLKAANVLLWTLDPSSLCHCKVTDFGIATHMAPVGARGLQGIKGFIAPEVLHIGKRKQRSVYDHKADIFSFGMFMYQIISRRHPYHNIAPHRIDVSVKAGDRPELQDVDVATTGYHYLTMLMKKCWEDNPKYRPDTEEIIKTVCLDSMQSVMCVYPIRSKFSVRQAIALTPVNFIAAGAPSKLQNELWVYCDGAEGAELNIFNSHNIMKTSKHFIKDSQVQCTALCNDHIWMCVRADSCYSISVINIASHELVKSISMEENSVSCLTAANDKVLVGTLEGYCLCFSCDVSNTIKPCFKYVCEHAVDGIACTSEYIWVSHDKYISFLNPDNLTVESFISRDEEQDAIIGHLSNSADDQIIWSAHFDGVLLSAWDAHNHVLCFDINTRQELQKIDNQASVHDSLITAMIPALDTVWVGMATGHILIFHKEELLTWYRPYQDYVRFLSLIPGSGPCEMEKCMVVSGGKAFQPLVNGMGPDYEKLDEKGQPLDKSGVLVIWEAYEAKTMRQIKLVQERSPNHLDTHNTVRQMILNGEFKDGTHINKVVQNGETADRPNYQDTTPYSPDLDAQPNGEFKDGTQVLQSKETTDRPNYPVTQPYIKEKFEVLEIELPGPDPDSTQVVCVTCPEPPQLKVLLSELQVNASLSESESRLEFRRQSGEVSQLRTQKQLENYLTLPNRPKLYVAKPNGTKI